MLQKLGLVSAILMDSYHVSYNVAKSKMPYKVAEELIEQCVTQRTTIVLGK